MLKERTPIRARVTSPGSASRSSPAAIPSATISERTFRIYVWNVSKSNGGAPCAGPRKMALIIRTHAFFVSKSA